MSAFLWCLPVFLWNCAATKQERLLPESGCWWSWYGIQYINGSIVQFNLLLNTAIKLYTQSNLLCVSSSILHFPFVAGDKGSNSARKQSLEAPALSCKHKPTLGSKNIVSNLVVFNRSFIRFRYGYTSPSHTSTIWDRNRYRRTCFWYLHQCSHMISQVEKYWAKNGTVTSTWNSAMLETGIL